MIGELIKEHREKAKMTQSELADKLGYETPQFVSLVERGLSKAPYGMIGKCIKVIGLPEKKIVKFLSEKFINEMVSGIDSGKESVK